MKERIEDLLKWLDVSISNYEKFILTKSGESKVKFLKLIRTKVAALLNTEENVQECDATKAESGHNRPANKNSGEHKEPDQDWKEQFRKQFCLRKPNGIDITNIVIDYTDRYVIQPLKSRIEELEAECLLRQENEERLRQKINNNQSNHQS